MFHRDTRRHGFEEGARARELVGACLVRIKNAEVLEPPGLGEVWLWACPSVHTYPAPMRGMREEERRATATPPEARPGRANDARRRNFPTLKRRREKLQIPFKKLQTSYRKQAKDQPRPAPILVFLSSHQRGAWASTRMWVGAPMRPRGGSQEIPGHVQPQLIIT